MQLIQKSIIILHFTKFKKHYFTVIIIFAVILILIKPSLKSYDLSKFNFNIDLPKHLWFIFAFSKKLNMVLLDQTVLKCINGNENEQKHACNNIYSNYAFRFGIFASNFTEMFELINNTIISDRTKNIDITVHSMIPTTNPDTVILKYIYSENIEKYIFITLLNKNGSNKSYYFLRGNNITSDIAIPFFSPILVVINVFEIFVPENIKQYLIYADTFKFVECNQTLAATYILHNSLPTKVPLKAIKMAAEFVDIFIESGQIPFLSFGTLLGLFLSTATTENCFSLHSLKRLFAYIEVPKNLTQKIAPTNVYCLSKKYNSVTTSNLAKFITDFTVFKNVKIIGWYRNCGLIPHTTDIDFNVFASEYNSSIEKTFLRHPKFPLKHRIGKREHSLEYSFTINHNIVGYNKTKIDIFYLYPQNETHEWVPFLDDFDKLIRGKSFSPKVTKLCTTDLYGYLFFVPCNFVEILKANYGKNWLISNSNATYFDEGSSNILDGQWKMERNELVYIFDPELLPFEFFN